MQGGVCVLCLPPGFPAVPQYPAHTARASPQARYYGRSDSSPPPGLPGVSAFVPLRLRKQGRGTPCAVRAVGCGNAQSAAVVVSGPRPPVMKEGRGGLPGSLTALSDRAIPHHLRRLPGGPALLPAGAGGFSMLRSLAKRRRPFTTGSLALRLSRLPPALRTPPHGDALPSATPPKSDRRGPDLHRLDPCAAGRTERGHPCPLSTAATFQASPPMQGSGHPSGKGL